MGFLIEAVVFFVSELTKEYWCPLLLVLFVGALIGASLSDRPYRAAGLVKHGFIALLLTAAGELFFLVLMSLMLLKDMH
jgi:hypothetical protein